MDRGQSLIIPPLFDGTNYAYWKVRMIAFLQFLDEKVWQAVEIGWTKPKEAQKKIVKTQNFCSFFATTDHLDAILFLLCNNRQFRR